MTISTHQAPPLVTLRGVTKTFGDVVALDDVTTDLNRHTSTALIGGNGAGKTTLLNLLGGLDKPSSGHIDICGQDIHRMSESGRARFRNRHLGFVYQFHHLLPEFSALENVMMPGALGGRGVRQASEQATAILERVGLGARLGHKPGELSGGERQRVAIARALVNEPECVLMDEPTGNLDEQTGESVRELIESLRDQIGIAFVLVTHDMAMARSLGRVLRLEQGELFQEL